ncbi:hypothetical protein AVEN_251868-1 [Araneus ventricosus]|uniref:Uncharacterized protein n=1 Tax=Araneus ventricosus TaxID=182803 RepID=A0A4Y2M7M2_ARAVE|nr:hypothetical protein AVEN_251868-1 [Araneus ventricosus]
MSIASVLMQLWPRQFLHKIVQRKLVLTHLHFSPQPLLHPLITDTFLAGASPLVVYMGVNDLFTTSSPFWMVSITVLAMFALGGMCDGSVDVQLLWLVVTWRNE